MLTQYLTYGLQSAGYEVICLEARQVSAALAAMRNKTDKNDARGIAQILRTGWYSRVHVKSLESHLIRALLSSRKAVLKKCVDLENELRGLIRLLGVRLPGTLKHGAFDAALREAIATHAALAPALIPLLDARLVLYQTYLKLDNQVKSLVREDAVCQRLMTVPGVGSITALTFKAGVDDPTRFKHSRTVAAHFGLTPRRYQSGEVDKPARSWADAVVRWSKETAHKKDHERDLIKILWLDPFFGSMRASQVTPDRYGREVPQTFSTASVVPPQMEW